VGVGVRVEVEWNGMSEVVVGGRTECCSGGNCKCSVNCILKYFVRIL
jgi:hypothetical protein